MTVTGAGAFQMTGHDTGAFVQIGDDTGLTGTFNILNGASFAMTNTNVTVNAVINCDVYSSS